MKVLLFRSLKGLAPPHWLNELILSGIRFDEGEVVVAGRQVGLVFRLGLAAFQNVAEWGQAVFVCMQVA